MVFDYSWRCPFDREQLLEIRRRQVIDPGALEELKARQLMDKFYVDDDESLLGSERLKTLHRFAHTHTHTHNESAKVYQMSRNEMASP